MGQKVHPVGIRLGIVNQHASVWYANKKDYKKQIHIDMQVRAWLMKALAHASVSKIVIERPADSVRIIVHTARPGIVIGKKGEDVENLRVKASQMMGAPTQIVIEEVRNPDLDAALVAQNIAHQIERRVMFRRSMKRAIQNAMRSGCAGIRVQVSGRLGGNDIARTEWYREGRVPLHTLRANIDYVATEARTTYGMIGVKVWLFKGEVMPERKTATKETN